MDRLRSLAEQWLKLDKNETTRAEIQQLLEANDEVELERRLGSRIQFGTAGLRAAMQAGFSRMNDLTVIQASQGLAAYILATMPSAPSIVIGYDHRYNSRRFARLAAAAMIQRGIKVYFYSTTVHTPLVPFGVSLLNASAGIMITASHNPAQDNGYKVYWRNGCQIIPPHDTNIAAAIEQHLTPECWDEDLVDNAPVELVEKPLARVQTAYFCRVNRLNVRPGAAAAAAAAAAVDAAPLKFVYTPMHGVGLPAMLQAAKDLGVEKDMVVVLSQAQPDPDFPTVRFPNPEERGALDLAISTADKNGITLVLASDPDADRFAAAEKLASGEWRTFTGNELGILFAAQILTVYRLSAPRIGKLSMLCMLCSTVSSQMLKSMAETEGFRFEETLTGFKWLGSRALELQEQGYDAVYAFEEAIGYMFSPVVHDKDGIAAARVFITMARELLLAGVTPYQKLQELYEKYGFFHSENSYFISPDPKLTERVFSEIRALGSPYPASLGSRKVTWWRDLTEGFDSATPDGKPTLPVSKSSQMITVELEGGVRFTVRGSGTEPKIKMYIECKADTEEAARVGAKEVAEDLTREWFRPTNTGLLLP